MTAYYLCLALLLLPAGSIALDIVRTPRDGAWTPRPKRIYVAPFGQPGAPLPKRPEGMAALKAEIALTPPEDTTVLKVEAVPPGYVPAPPLHLRTRPKHVDWLDTQEIEKVWDEHFADQPDDQAVQRVWAGVGR